MKELWKNLKFAWSYSKDHKVLFLGYFILSGLGIAIGIISPILSAKIIISLTENDLFRVLYLAIAIFATDILWSTLRFFNRKINAIIYRESFSKIQVDLGRNILKLENEVLDENGSGVFIQRLTGDTTRLAEIFNILNNYLTNLITDVGIFIALFIINKLCFFFIFFVTFALLLVEKFRVQKFNEKDKIARKSGEKVSSFVGEIVRGARDIKMLNAEDSFIGELKGRIKILNGQKYEMQDTNRKYNVLIDYILDFEALVLIGLLVIMIKNGYILATTALVVYNYANRVPNIIFYLGNIFDVVKDFNLSADRVYDVINGKEFKKEEFGNEHIDKVEGNFEFKNVTFSYKDEKVLKNINFKVDANSTTAFVGKSGAGKTTIFNLLCKMYDVDSGTITIDGIDIKKLDRESIRGNITIISQDPYIFNLSIKDNLRLVKENLTDKEMKKACKIACLDEFINSLPDKYDTIIGEGGVNLSGGQKQRLAIARALVQKTEIILFDEATSSLDNETQASIQQAIDNMKNEYTILIIAHRLSTIINSDRILFLNDGKIEMEGTHKELLKKSKAYKHLYESEITKE